MVDRFSDWDEKSIVVDSGEEESKDENARKTEKPETPNAD